MIVTSRYTVFPARVIGRSGQVPSVLEVRPLNAHTRPVRGLMEGYPI